MIDEKVLCITNQDYPYFLNKTNVIGVALGYKIKNGFYTSIKCIKVFVTKKVSCNQLLKKDLVPIVYKGIPTDVVERCVQKVYSFNKRIRPVLGGYNIGPERHSSSGTMGCLVKDDKDICMLSNNHVLTGEEEVQIGTNILQPCYVLGGKPIKDAIGKLSRFVALKYIKGEKYYENHVDCAIAKVCDKSLISSKIALLGSIKGVASCKLGQTVKKVGSTTELTTGKITEIGASLIVDLYNGSCLFKDQIITTSMAKPGDSGSILLDNSMNVIGLLMSGDSSETTFNSIKNVLSSLNVKIIV